MENKKMGQENLLLNLVYNPQGPELPPGQTELESLYKKKLDDEYGIQFNNLYTITNMPIARFGSTLISKGSFIQYMSLLKKSFSSKFFVKLNKDSSQV